MEFAGKVGVVTGGTRGIGKAIAAALIAKGAKVYGWARDEKAGRQLERELGVQYIFQQADVTDNAKIEALTKELYEKEGRIDFLVNNAAIARDNLLLRMREEDWDAVLNINLKGAYICTKAVARYMLRQHKGAILNIASVVGEIGNPGQANYVAAKAGLIGFTKSIAKELGCRGIRVNALAPGFIATGMTEGLSDELKKKYLEAIPLGRFGSAEEVAEAACFLLSDRASYITGQVLNIDGGMVM